MRNKYLVMLGALLMILALPVYAQDCYGDDECYDQPDSGGESQSSEPPWEGLTDGRLNPDMAEYYSVWCVNSEVRVLRAVPQPTVQVDAIPIQEVADLPDGGVLTRDSGLTVTRTGDTITLSGNNGNLAPQPGSKSFDREECLADIGEAVVEQQFAETQQQNLEYCADNFDPDNCLEDSPLLPPEVIACLFQYLTGAPEEHMTDKCRADGLWVTIGNAIGYIVAIVINCGGGLLFGIVIGPGSFGVIQWRKRKQRLTTHKER
jgi:hypothetical protein